MLQRGKTVCRHPTLTRNLVEGKVQKHKTVTRGHLAGLVRAVWSESAIMARLKVFVIKIAKVNMSLSQRQRQ